MCHIYYAEGQPSAHVSLLAFAHWGWENAGLVKDIVYFTIKYREQTGGFHTGGGGGGLGGG